MRQLAYGILGLWLLAALASAALPAADPSATAPGARLLPPQWAHPMGTDQFGRDMLARVLGGARYAALGVALSTLIAGVLGTALGLLAGYSGGGGQGQAGGTVDALLVRLFDLWLGLPSLLLAIAIVGAVGPSYWVAMLAIGVVRVPSFARIVRAAALSLRHASFVEGARAAGATPGRMMVHHVLPNLLGPLVALVGVRGSTALLAGSALSFVGLGAPIPQPEWGALVAGGRPYLESAWWISAFPCLALILAALSLQVTGDALRDRLDPTALI